MIREILGAWRDVPAELYRDEGLVLAVAFVVTSPLLVPLAAIVYYSMDTETRALLDESGVFVDE